MVFLKKVEMVNFKSYGNRKVTLTFPKGFTAIVGPNGSGKSNVVDAVLFVLGRLGSKSLRASVLTDLIFAGSKSSKPSKYAKVTVWFDNRDRAFPLDNDEVQISRKVNSDGRTEYRLNGKLTTRTEIVDMLSLANVSPNGLNIILQGEVSRIVMMSPLERRRLIEEIAGISHFDEKREKARKELEEAKRKISQLELLHVEIQKQLEKLRREKEEAERWLALSKEIRRKRAALLSARYYNLRGKLDEMREKLRVVEEEVGEVSVRRSILVERQGRLEEEIRLEEENRKRMARQSQELTSKIRVLTSQVAEMQAEVKYEERKLEDAERSIEKLMALFGRVEELIAENSERMRESEEDRSRISRMLSDEERKLEELRRERDSVKESLKEIREQLYEVRREEKEVEEKVNSLRIKAGDAFNALALISSGIREKERELSLLERERERLMREISELKARVEEWSSVISRASSILPLLTQEQKKLNGKVKELKGRMEEVKGEKARLEALMEAQHLLAPQKRREFTESLRRKGVKAYGFLIDLCEVDEEKRDILGSLRKLLTVFLVEDLNDVREAIWHSREEGLTRITVFPRSMVKPCSVKVNSVLRYVRSRGFSDVFSYLLGDVVEGEGFEEDAEVVAEDGITYTRKGLVVAENLPVLRYSLILERLHDESEVLREKVEKYSRIAEKAATTLLILEREAASLMRQREEAASRISILHEELSGIENSVVRLQALINDFRLKEEAQRREAAEARSKLEEYERKLEEVAAKRRDLEDKLSTPILGEFEELIRRKEEKIGKVKEELQKVELKLAKLQAEKEGLEGERERATLELNSARARMREGRERIDSKRRILVDVEGVLAESERKKEAVDEALRHTQEVLEEKREELKKVDKEIRELTGRLEKLLSVQGSIKSEIGKLEAEVEGVVREAEGEQVTLSRSSLSDSDMERLEGEVAQLLTEKEKLEPVNLKAPEQYEEAKSRSSEFGEKILELVEERKAIERLIEEISQRKKKVFLEAIEVINRYFNEFFSELSPGGWAQLVLEDEGDPFEGGVLIRAKPGGKEVKSLEAMSGGEKSLTTIAFIFAIYRYKPAPFYLLDEIDAFLDKENVRRVAKLIKKLSRESQFIIISLRDLMVSEADKVYGVASVDGVSTVVGVDLERVLPYVEAEGGNM